MAIFTAAALAKAGAGLSIGSSIAGIFGGISGNRKARDLAKTQAMATHRQRMEEIRRLERDRSRVVGSNIAAIGASNVIFSGSARRVLDDVRAELNNDINWRRIAAQQEKRSIMANAPGRRSDIAVGLRGAASIGQTMLGYYGR